MDGGDLDTELRRTAASSAESILNSAREEAERVAAEADRSIEDTRKERMQDREAEYGAEARAMLAAERHAARRAVLLAQTRVVDRVLERAKALVPETVHLDAYLSTIGDQLTEALQFVDGDGTVVRCSKALEHVVREGLGDRPEVTVEPVSDAGTGFTIVGGRGSVLVDLRLETRIDRSWPLLAIEIRSRLQGL